jgi:hypothetical protein
MTLSPDLVRSLSTASSAEAWKLLTRTCLDLAKKPILATSDVPGEMVKRDREVGSLDHFLSNCAWELWKSFGEDVERTSDRLTRWWKNPFSSKAILILDGLSLRELPILLQQAEQRGFKTHEIGAFASELPADTQTFAQALDFSSRSQLQNNGAENNRRFPSAHTESVALPWKDCEALIDSHPNWVFWHHWPDEKAHAFAGAGQGLHFLARDCFEQLQSDDFWNFITRLTKGRHLVITSDHGYAAPEYFPDAEGDVANYLKQTFSSGRSKQGKYDSGTFVPPVALQIDNAHGTHVLALGRRKWRSQGGYPTLTHGGLSLLEVLSPLVEISI